MFILEIYDGFFKGCVFIECVGNKFPHRGSQLCLSEIWQDHLQPPHSGAFNMWIPGSQAQS